VCTGGYCTAGPGSLPPEDHPDFLRLEREAEGFIAALAGALTRGSIVVDVFGAGQCPLDVPMLYPLTQNTGGSLLMYESFESREYLACLKAAHDRFVGVGAVVDLRLSEKLAVEQIIGPIKPLSHERQMQRMAAAAGGGLSELSDNAVEMTSAEKGHGITVAFRVKGDIPQAAVYLQMDVRYTDLSDGKVKHRVVTASASVTSSGREFILSVDPLAVGAVVAKQALVDIRKAGYTPTAIGKLQKDLALRVYDMCRNFSPKIQPPVSSKLASFLLPGWLAGKPTVVIRDEELAKVAEFVYHLSRTLWNMCADQHKDEKMMFVAHLLSRQCGPTQGMIWPYPQPHPQPQAQAQGGEGPVFLGEAGDRRRESFDVLEQYLVGYVQSRLVPALSREEPTFKEWCKDISIQV